MKTVLPPIYLFILSIAGLLLIGMGVISSFMTIYEMIGNRLVSMGLSTSTEYQEAAARLHLKAFLYGLVPMTIIFSAAGFLAWNAVTSLMEVCSDLCRKPPLRRIFSLRVPAEA